MARIVLIDAKITIGGVNLSDHITSVALSTSDDVVDTSAFGTGAARLRVAGLADNSVTLEFQQDFAASNVEATIYPMLGSTQTVVVTPTSATGGTATNPSYTFSALVSEWQPLSGAVGELATVSVTWPISGAITKVAV
jgi:hypothetical protein